MSNTCRPGSFSGRGRGVLLILGLSSLAVLPINWAGAALLLIAIAFFVLEAEIHFARGAGLGGATALDSGRGAPGEWSAGNAHSLDDRVFPRAAVRVISLFLTSVALKARRSEVITGTSALLDEVGTARTALAPSGQVFIHGEYWQAIGSVNIEKGGKVRVRRVEGLKLYVDPADSVDANQSLPESSPATDTSSSIRGQ